MFYPYRYNPGYWDYEENPDSRETAIRRLLQKLTGASWKAGQPAPREWFISHVSSHPEWTPIWLVATALDAVGPVRYKNVEELLQDIRPGRRRLRDIDELGIFYDYMKELLATKGIVKGRDISDLASTLGLVTLSGPGNTEAKERSYLLKQLVLDGYAEQRMGRFKGSSYYLPTQKLLQEHATRAQKKLPVPESPSITPMPPTTESEVPIPFYLEAPEDQEEPPMELAPTTTTGTIPPTYASPDVGVSPDIVRPVPLKPKVALKKILIIGGQSSSCPNGQESLRAIKDKECEWLDQTFNWRVLPSYRTEAFREEHLPIDVDLVIVFSKFMSHPQVNLVTAHCKKHGIPFINNIKGAQLGGLQMAAEQAKTHSPKWFYEEYSKFAARKKASITRKKAEKPKKDKKKKKRSPRHDSRLRKVRR